MSSSKFSVITFPKIKMIMTVD